MDALLSRRDIRNRIGLSDSQLTRDLRAGLLPKPTVVGWHTRWTEADFDSYLINREKRRRIAKAPDELTRLQVAKKLGVSGTQLHRLAKAGKLPEPFRRIGIRPLYKRDAIAAFLASRTQEPADQLTLAQVSAMTGMLPCKVSRHRRERKFPQPNYRLSKRRPRWNADEIFAYVAAHPLRTPSKYTRIVDESNQFVTSAQFGYLPDTDFDILAIAHRIYAVSGHKLGRPTTILVKQVAEIPSSARTIWQVEPNGLAHIRTLPVSV